MQRLQKRLTNEYASTPGVTLPVGIKQLRKSLPQGKLPQMKLVSNVTS